MPKVPLGKVLVVEDDQFIRLALESSLVASGFEITASVGRAKEALASKKLSEAEVALLDLDLGVGPTGIDLAHALRKINPRIGIIFLTSFVDPRFADIRNRAIPAGSRYLVKSEITNISQVISVLLQTKHRPFNENVNQMNRFEALTDVQIEVWRSVSEGLSSSEIAERRGISEKAVEAILSRIYTFLEIKKTKSTNPRILLANSYKKLSGKI
jgi:DNA-binding NarL/FixJ family response regulator